MSRISFSLSYKQTTNNVWSIRIVGISGDLFRWFAVFVSDDTTVVATTFGRLEALKRISPPC